MAFALPPPPPAVIMYVNPQCVQEVAIRYDLPMALLVAVMHVEGGTVGKKSMNSNGTVDYGPMQVNSLWLPELQKFGITKETLRDNGCVNVAVGSWILRKNIDREKKSIWRGIGAYHSKTKKLNERYSVKIRKAIAKNLDLAKTLAKANGFLQKRKGS